MSTYEVIGQLPYRGHAPGDVFATVLDPATEARAVARGNIRVLDRHGPRLEPGSWTLPAGWESRDDGAPRGASSVEEGDR